MKRRGVPDVDDCVFCTVSGQRGRRGRYTRTHAHTHKGWEESESRQGWGGAPKRRTYAPTDQRRRVRRGCARAYTQTHTHKRVQCPPLLKDARRRGRWGEVESTANEGFDAGKRNPRGEACMSRVCMGGRINDVYAEDGAQARRTKHGVPELNFVSYVTTGSPHVRKKEAEVVYVRLSDCVCLCRRVGLQCP